MTLSTSQNAHLLNQELNGATYSTYAHHEDGDLAYQANLEEVQALIEQIPDMLEEMKPEEIQDLAQALEVNGLDLENLDIPGLDEIDPELLKNPAFMTALELEMEEMDIDLLDAEMDEVNPEEQPKVYQGMTLDELQAKRDALEQEGIQFRFEQDRRTVEKDISEEVANGAKAAGMHGELEKANGNFNIAEEKTLQAWVNNDLAANNEIMGEDREAKVAQMDEALEKSAAPTVTVTSGPFGTG